MSDFVRQVKNSDFDEHQFVLATADKALAEIASVLFCGGESEDPRDEFTAAFEKWWPKRDAMEIANRLIDGIEIAMRRPPPGNPDVDPFPKIIGEGENFVLNWTGPNS